MKNVQMLSEANHQNLKVKTAFEVGLGYDRPTSMLLPSEIEDAQREYVILFRRNEESNKLVLNVLLGLEAGENLYLSGDKWGASYQPLAIRKGPLLMGPNPDESEGGVVFFLDLDDPRVNADSGESLFNKGDPTSWLNNQRAILQALHAGWPDMEVLASEFETLGLIEPLRLDIELKNGQSLDLDGAFSISEEKLAAMTAEQLASLNEKGLLKLAFFIASSLHNFVKLIEIKNAGL